MTWNHYAVPVLIWAVICPPLSPPLPPNHPLTPAGCRSSPDWFTDINHYFRLNEAAAVRDARCCDRDGGGAVDVFVFAASLCNLATTPALTCVDICFESLQHSGWCNSDVTSLLLLQRTNTTRWSRTERHLSPRPWSRDSNGGSFTPLQTLVFIFW